jgi:arginase family enzyme
VRAISPESDSLTIVHFDAHPDLYENFEGNRFSHACPFARIMESSLCKRLIQIGIRSATGPQREQMETFGVELFEMRHWAGVPDLRFEGDVYLSLDLDALDPAYAPGVSHREPGGLSTRDVIVLIQKMAGRLVGADVVEYNPRMDFTGITAVTAAKLVKEILGAMLLEP